MNRTEKEYTEQNKIQAIDHDSIIRLESKVDQILTDIKELKDGFSSKIDDHEKRLQTLESIKTKMVGVSVAIGIALTLAGFYIRGFIEDIYKHLYGH